MTKNAVSPCTTELRRPHLHFKKQQFCKYTSKSTRLMAKSIDTYFITNISRVVAPDQIQNDILSMVKKLRFKMLYKVFAIVNRL